MSPLSIHIFITLLNVLKNFQYDNEGVAVVLVHDQKKNFYKKFLYEPFPVESSLLEVLSDHLNAEIVAGKYILIIYMTQMKFCSDLNFVLILGRNYLILNPMKLFFQRNGKNIYINKINISTKTIQNMLDSVLFTSHMSMLQVSHPKF